MSNIIADAVWLDDVLVTLRDDDVIVESWSSRFTPLESYTIDGFRLGLYQIEDQVILNNIASSSLSEFTLLSKQQLTNFDDPSVYWHNDVTGVIRWHKITDQGLSGSQFVTRVDDLDWEVVKQVDMNNDGHDDLILRNERTGRSWLWFMKEGSIFGGQQLTGLIDPSWKIVGVADIDSDNAKDILFRHNVTGQTILWPLTFYGLGLGYYLLERVSNLDYEVAGLADADGDGKADIFWRNN